MNFFGASILELFAKVFFLKMGTDVMTMEYLRLNLNLQGGFMSSYGLLTDCVGILWNC